MLKYFPWFLLASSCSLLTPTTVEDIIDGEIQIAEKVINDTQAKK